MTFVLVFLFIAVFAGGLSWFQFRFKPEMIKGFIARAAPPPPTVAVAEAKSETWTTRIPAIGTFRAVQGIDVMPQVGGVVRAIKFDSGQDVTRGQSLIEIDDSVEQADLQSNTAALRNAELALERQKQLIAGGSTAKAQVDQAQSARDQAAGMVERTKSLIAQKALAAPFAGRLGLRKVDVGQYVSPGTSLVTLQQLDPVFVDFPIPEQSFGQLRADQSVEVVVDAYPTRVFQGTIRSVDARVSSDTRNVLVRAQIPNPDKLLRPGMFARVDVLAGDPVNVVTLPRTAITYSLYGDSVFVARPAPAADGSAQAATPETQQYVVERRAVRVGDTKAESVGIVEGIEAGDLVVSEGQLKLQTNMRVRIDNSSGLPAATIPRPKG